ESIDNAGLGIMRTLQLRSLHVSQDQIAKAVTVNCPSRWDYYSSVWLFNDQRPALLFFNVPTPADGRLLKAMFGTKIRLADRRGEGNTPLFRDLLYQISKPQATGDRRGPQAQAY